MTLNEIITRAASVYPECWVLQYWDMKRQCAVENRDGGDTLAEFVALELHDTFDPDASDREQLDMAIRKMREAGSDLHAVAAALDNQKKLLGDRAADAQGSPWGYRLLPSEEMFRSAKTMVVGNLMRMAEVRDRAFDELSKALGELS